MTFYLTVVVVVRLLVELGLPGLVAILPSAPEGPSTPNRTRSAQTFSIKELKALNKMG